MNNTWASGSDWTSEIDILDDVSNVMSSGFVGGLYFTYEFNEYIAVQTEALASENGWEAEGTDAGNPFMLNYYFFSLEVPVMVKGMLPVWKGSFVAMAGPVFFFPLFNLTEHVTQGGTPETTTEVEIETAFHVGVTAGLGYELYLKKWCIGLDARYVRTFTSMHPTLDELHLDSFVVNLYTGFRF